SNSGSFKTPSLRHEAEVTWAFCPRKQFFPAVPGFIASLLIALACVRSFAGAHKAVAGTFVSHGLIGLTRSRHVFFCLRNRGVDAIVVSGIKAVNRGGNVFHRVL